MSLTAKQQAFVDEYLVDLNATQAAIRAGYSLGEKPPSGYYTYFLINDQTGFIFYVGKGKHKRMCQHLAIWKRGAEPNPLKAAYFDNLLARGGAVQHLVFSEHGTDEASAFRVERLLIDAFSKVGLTNLVPGQVTDMERAGMTASSLLRQVKPLEHWRVERNPSASEIELYWAVIKGLQGIKREWESNDA